MSRALLLVALVGCVIQSDRSPRPRDLEPSWLANRPRLLAIRADPPDVLPGGSAALQALFADPEEELRGSLWLGCADAATTSFGCALDPTALSPDASLDDLIAAGVIGFEPGWEPEVTAPPDYLEGLDARVAARGRPYTATVIGLPDSVDDDEIDFNRIRVGFKRVMVTTREPPNRNPEIVALLVDGEPVTPDEPVVVASGETYELDLALRDDAIETYVHLTVDGALEERTEQPFAEWYASGGTVRRATTIHPFLYSTWTAPSEPDMAGTWWVVLKDRRGGLSWLRQDWRTR
jgi:hypothetical protein